MELGDEGGGGVGFQQTHQGEPPHEFQIGNLLEPRIRRERREETYIACLRAFAPCGAAVGGRADQTVLATLAYPPGIGSVNGLLSVVSRQVVL